MAVSKRLRFEVLRRDGHACQYCGQMAPDVTLTVDHVKPKALGGKDSPENLVAACRDCNAGKSSINLDAPMVEAIAQRNIEWAERAAMMSAKMRGTLERDAEYVEEFEEAWDEGQRATGRESALPYGHRATIMHWAEVGVPEEALENFVEIAMGRKRIADEEVFTYLCGIVWNRIKQADIDLEVPDDPRLYTEQEHEDHGIDSWNLGWDSGQKNGVEQVANNIHPWIVGYDTVTAHIDGRVPKPIRHLVEHHPALADQYRPQEKEKNPWLETMAV